MTVRVIEDLEELFADAKVADKISRQAYSAMPQELKNHLVPGSFAARLLVTGAYESKPLCLFYEIIESEYEQDRRTMAKTPHITLTNAYSTMCVEGELGNAHLCGLLPISEDSFNTAKDREWDVSMDELNSWVQTRMFLDPSDGTAD
tara:strand:+ start:1267 stop:1707 length:441 start_codon:yes stop_codon:yes gene_type:complete